MKSRLITMVLLLSLGSGTDAAYPPPPVSAYCRITCIVQEKAEWKTDGQPAEDLFITAPHVQTHKSTPVLIINSHHDSTVEMDANGKFQSSHFPIDIIVSVMPGRHTESQKDTLITTITACWKI